MNIYDIIIIGGGPAGITAGIYAARQNLNVLLVTGSFGGQMARKTVAIENYTGFTEISGSELIDKFENHLRRYKIEIEIGSISELKKDGNFFISALSANGKIFRSLSAIIASGAEPRKLNIDGEQEYIGRGLSYCTTCDGPVFTGKTVAVVGGGNAGLEAALFLSGYARKIYILEYGETIKADAILQESAEKTGKIEIITNAVLKRILGKTFVELLEYQDMKENKPKQISVRGIFAEIGNNPAAAIAGDLVDLNERKEIIIDHVTNQTKTPGLFAAGDVTNVIHKQVIIAAGDGAKAAMSACNYLLKTNNK